MSETEALLASVARLAGSMNFAVSKLQARDKAMACFFEAIAPQLTRAQCIEAKRLFLLGIEESITDDTPTSPEYHSAFLEQADLLKAMFDKLERSASRVAQANVSLRHSQWP